jgi:hypothetical protein
MKSFAIQTVISAVDNVTNPIARISRQVTRSLEGVEKVSQRVQGRLKSFTGTPLGGIAGAAAAYLTYDKLKSAYEECTQAAAAEAAAERKLGVLMGDAPGGTRGAIEAARDYAYQLEKVYHISHESTMAMEAQLSALRLSPSVVNKLILPMMNYAESQFGIRLNGEQATETAKRLGRALIGQAGSLTKAGIAMSDNEKKLWKQMSAAQRADMIIKKLNERYNGMAEANAKSGGGQRKGMEDSIRRDQEKIGKALLPLRAKFLSLEVAAMPLIEAIANKLAPAISKSVSWITRAVDVTSKWAKENPGLAKTAGIIVASLVGLLVVAGPILRVISIVGTLVGWIVKIGQVLAPAIEWFTTFGVSIESIGALVTPIGWVVAAVAALAGIGYVVYRNWDKVKKFFVNLWAFLSGNSPMARIIKTIFPLIGVTVTIIKNWDRIKQYFASFKTWFIGLWKSITDSPAWKVFIKMATWAAAEGKAAWKWATTDPPSMQPAAHRPTFQTVGSVQQSHGHGGTLKIDIGHHPDLRVSTDSSGMPNGRVSVHRTGRMLPSIQ